MFQIGFFTLCYNLLDSDWCLESSEAGQTVSERRQLASVPSDIGDSFLGSALEFGGLWSGLCLRVWTGKVERFLLNVDYQWVAA